MDAAHRIHGDVKAALADYAVGLSGLYGDRLVQLVLFGSHARGDAQAGSDIDVLVVLRGDVQPGKEIARTGEIAARVSLDHDAVVSATFISEERYQREHSPFLINIRREGVPA